MTAARVRRQQVRKLRRRRRPCAASTPSRRSWQSLATHLARSRARASAAMLTIINSRCTCRHPVLHGGRASAVVPCCAGGSRYQWRVAWAAVAITLRLRHIAPPQVYPQTQGLGALTGCGHVWQGVDDLLPVDKVRMAMNRPGNRGAALQLPG